MRIDLGQACQLLKRVDRVLILTHKSPDGDTLGSGFGLCYALRQMGKQAYVDNSDGIPKKFGYLVHGQAQLDFEPDFIVSVDTAAPDLLGGKLSVYADKIDLCVDHHMSNTIESKYLYVDSKASSASEIIFRMIDILELAWTKHMADAIYTGICTDTGCFKFSNTTPNAHRFAARLIEAGADYEKINSDMFIIKSRARMDLERHVLDNMEFYFDGRCSMTTTTREDMKVLKADASTYDGIPAITKQIEGVEVGISIRETDDDNYKISFRTSAEVNASELAQTFGGGGHIRAAGCSIKADTLQKVKDRLLETVQRSLTEFYGRNTLYK